MWLRCDAMDGTRTGSLRLLFRRKWRGEPEAGGDVGGEGEGGGVGVGGEAEELHAVEANARELPNERDLEGGVVRVGEGVEGRVGGDFGHDVGGVFAEGLGGAGGGGL